MVTLSNTKWKSTKEVKYLGSEWSISVVLIGGMVIDTVGLCSAWLQRQHIWGQPLWILRQSLPQENHNFPRLIDIAVAQCQNTCMCPWQRKRMHGCQRLCELCIFLLICSYRATLQEDKGSDPSLFDPGMVPRWIRIRIRIRPQYHQDAGWRPELVRRNAWKNTLSRDQ